MTIRSVGELDATLEDVNDSMSYAPDSAGYCQGCAAALEWVTGQRRVGPLDTSRFVTADEAGIHDQLKEALDMLNGVRRPAFTSSYISGVEGTLAWVLGLVDEPPV